jgi:hypothetical protein
MVNTDIMLDEVQRTPIHNFKMLLNPTSFYSQPLARQILTKIPRLFKTWRLFVWYKKTSSNPVPNSS